MIIDLTYTFRCGIVGCPQTATQEFPKLFLTYGRVIPLPSPPAGWVVLGSLLVCPQHQLRVTVDDHVVPDAMLPFYG